MKVNAETCQEVYLYESTVSLSLEEVPGVDRCRWGHFSVRMEVLWVNWIRWLRTIRDHSRIINLS